MAILGQIRAEQARQEAEAMFQRTLAGWAHDVLRLRAAGLDRPTARTACGPVTAPARRAA
jgi:hypothetical protein